MYKKSQANIADFFVALFIFSVLIVSIMLILNIYTSKLNASNEYNDMLINAFHISDLLVESAGKPALWNGSNVEVIGLVNNDRNISASKLNEFNELDYENIKTLFNIKNYEFYFNLKKLNNETLLTKGSAFNGDLSVKINRYVLYENENAVVELTLWK